MISPQTESRCVNVFMCVYINIKMYVTCEEFLRTIDESSFGDVGQENSDSVLD